MLAVKGVGSVARVGGVTREIRVELDPGRLLGLRLTAAEVTRQLRQQQQRPRAGAPALGRRQNLRAIGTVADARRHWPPLDISERQPPPAAGPDRDRL